MVTITLLIPRNGQSSIAQQTGITQLALDQGTYAALGLSQTSDNVLDLGTDISRTIVLDELPVPPVPGLVSLFRRQFQTVATRAAALHNLLQPRMSTLGTPGVTQTTVIAPP